jgi:hypothetical protein
MRRCEESELQQHCLRTVYLFGSAEIGHLGHVALRADGKVRGLRDPSWARYGFVEDRFFFLNEAGRAIARLRYQAEANCFLPDDAAGLYMVPLLTLDPPQEAAGGARLLINTIPKSGTYLLDLILSEIGYRGIGLHLIPNECHDNRGVPPEMIHRDPFSRRIFCPASAVARVLAPREYAVGHVNDEDQLRLIDQEGVRMIHCMRDLRDVLVSLFQFKRKSVDPQAPAEHVWLGMEGREAFLAFLCASAARELVDLREFAAMMPRLPGVKLRFEDLTAGIIPAPQLAALEAIEEGLGVMIAETLPRCLGQDTSTLSGQRSDWRDLWSPTAEEFFIRSGLAGVNRVLGYE